MNLEFMRIRYDFPAFRVFGTQMMEFGRNLMISTNIRTISYFVDCFWIHIKYIEFGTANQHKRNDLGMPKYNNLIKFWFGLSQSENNANSGESTLYVVFVVFSMETEKPIDALKFHWKSIFLLCWLKC